MHRRPGHIQSRRATKVAITPMVFSIRLGVPRSVLTALHVYAAVGFPDDRGEQHLATENAPPVLWSPWCAPDAVPAHTPLPIRLVTRGGDRRRDDGNACFLVSLSFPMRSRERKERRCPRSKWSCERAMLSCMKMPPHAVVMMASCALSVEALRLMRKSSQNFSQSFINIGSIPIGYPPHDHRVSIEVASARCLLHSVRCVHPTRSNGEEHHAKG